MSAPDWSPAHEAISDSFCDARKDHVARLSPNMIADEALDALRRAGFAVTAVAPGEALVLVRGSDGTITTRPVVEAGHARDFPPSRMDRGGWSFCSSSQGDRAWVEVLGEEPGHG